MLKVNEKTTELGYLNKCDCKINGKLNFLSIRLFVKHLPNFKIQHKLLGPFTLEEKVCVFF